MNLPADMNPGLFISGRIADVSPVAREVIGVGANGAAAYRTHQGVQPPALSSYGRAAPDGTRPPRCPHLGNRQGDWR